jgi:hypothetical protein
VTYAQELSARLRLEADRGERSAWWSRSVDSCAASIRAEEATIGPPELLAPRSAGRIVVLRGALHRQEDAVGGLTPAVD